jgi:hypothetical protein
MYNQRTSVRLFVRQSPSPDRHRVQYATLEVTAIYANALGAEEQGIAARMWS